MKLANFFDALRHRFQTNEPKPLTEAKRHMLEVGRFSAVVRPVNGGYTFLGISLPLMNIEVFRDGNPAWNYLGRDLDDLWLGLRSRNTAFTIAANLRGFLDYVGLKRSEELGPEAIFPCKPVQKRYGPFQLYGPLALSRDRESGRVNYELEVKFNGTSCFTVNERDARDLSKLTWAAIQLTHWLERSRPAKEFPGFEKGVRVGLPNEMTPGVSGVNRAETNTFFYGRGTDGCDETWDIFTSNGKHLASFEFWDEADRAEKNAQILTHQLNSYYESLRGLEKISATLREDHQHKIRNWLVTLSEEFGVPTAAQETKENAQERAKEATQQPGTPAISEEAKVRPEDLEPVDFLIEDCGTLWRFTPQSDQAKAFARNDLPLESWQWSKESVVVDHRPARRLADQLAREGWDVVNISPEMLDRLTKFDEVEAANQGLVSGAPSDHFSPKATAEPKLKLLPGRPKLSEAAKQAVELNDFHMLGKVVEKLRFKLGYDYQRCFDFVHKHSGINAHEYDGMLHEFDSMERNTQEAEIKSMPSPLAPHVGTPRASHQDQKEQPESLVEGSERTKTPESNSTPTNQERIGLMAKRTKKSQAAVAAELPKVSSEERKETPEAAADSKAERRAPFCEIRLGRVRASVWDRQHGDSTRWTANLNRLYRDKQGQWRRTDSFDEQDLAHVSQLAREAEATILKQLALAAVNGKGSTPAAIQNEATRPEPTSVLRVERTRADVEGIDKSRLPMCEIRSGRVRASVWDQEQGGSTRWTVTLSRSYRDREGKWHRTSSWDLQDLQHVDRLAQEAGATIQKRKAAVKAPVKDKESSLER
jgi:hypothetical protein